MGFFTDETHGMITEEVIARACNPNLSGEPVEVTCHPPTEHTLYQTIPMTELTMDPVQTITYPDPKETANQVILQCLMYPNGMALNSTSIETIKYVAQELVKALDEIKELQTKIGEEKTQGNPEYRIVQDPEFWSSRRISGGD